MGTSLRTAFSYLFGGCSVLASVATWWTGANAILVGTLVGGATLLVVGLLFMTAGVLALPPTRQRLYSRFDIEFSAAITATLSGGAVVLGVVLLVAAFIALLTA